MSRHRWSGGKRRRGSFDAQQRIHEHESTRFRLARPDHADPKLREVAENPTIPMTKKEDSPGYAERQERKRRQPPTNKQKGLLRALEDAAGEEHVNCANKLICEIRIDTMKRQIADEFGPDALHELLDLSRNLTKQRQLILRLKQQRRDINVWGYNPRIPKAQGRWRSSDA